MKYKIIILVSLLYSSFTFSQENTANIWYFADHAGISFNTGIPLAITDGQTDILEGCATLCDEDGALLFYTDGMTVWNKNHQIMPNGSGLMGNPSATQSAIITPYPQNDSLFIVFTIDARENNLQNGLRYSVINLNLDAGLGAVTNDKNILLSTPVSEKLTAIIKNNQYDYWIIAHEWDSDNFLSYSITNSGVNPTPVVSSIGCVHEEGGSFAKQYSIGYLKSSIDGYRIAATHYKDAGFFELFDFDKVTGLLTNVQTSATTFYRSYGIEFSPNGDILYGSHQQLGANDSKIYQFDLTQANPLDNPVLVASSPTSTLAALQLGPNGKIYVAIYNAYNYLGVINNPDTLGVNCDFVHDAVYLEGGLSERGLPSLFYYKGFQFFTGSEVDVSICEGDSIYLENAYQTVADTYYDTVQTNQGWDSIINTHLEILSVVTTPTITENSGVLTSSSAINYQWYFNGNLISGATTQNYQPFVTGTYQVVAINTNDCESWSDEYYFVYVGINELNNSFEIYPNPINNILSINGNKTFGIKILDLKGREILIYNIKTNRKDINMSQIETGIYLLKIVTDEKVMIRKIIKQ